MDILIGMRRKLFTLFFVAAVIPPPISTLVKPELYRKMIDDRDVEVAARLDDHHYSYFTSMQVNAPLATVHANLTNYRLYSQLIPYIDKTEFNEKTQILKLEGGLLGWRLASFIHFEEKGDRWIQYQIVGGHFTGLKGNIYYEPLGEKGTLVYLDGALDGQNWPPKFIIERGAEFVFGFTARRMRSYIEAHKLGEDSNDPKVPRPRRHL
jgi:hypothetical protein